VRGWFARLVWSIQCRLNRELFGGQAPDLGSLYRHRGIRIDVSGSVRPTLLVGVTTFGRPEECARLIQSLAESLKHAGLFDDSFLVIVRDTSTHDYSVVFDTLNTQFAARFAFYESNEWRGKPGRYLTYQILFNAARALCTTYALFFEDDVAIPIDFVQRSIALFEAIEDPRKAALYLARFPDDNAAGQWVRFKRRALARLAVDETAWLDLHAFIANRSFFDTLHWKLFRPHRWRWVGNAKRSSGVSEQMTLRLFGRNSIYQVRSSLAFHGRAPSLLNVEARRERTLDNFPHVDAES